MQLRLLTPDGIVLETECKEVLIPAIGGRLGIQGGHTHLVVPILAGELIVKTASQETRYRVGTGSAEATPKCLTVLASSAEPVS